jgi:PD-(D/E)XK nuclease superfamily
LAGFSLSTFNHKEHRGLHKGHKENLMTPFLEELAQKIIASHSKLEDLTIIFPNRRAALFFRSYLSTHLNQPVWSPTLITIEELFNELSDLQEADRLSLIFKLFHVYRKVMNKEESFDRFYFWGDMLLRDFDEVDKYLVAAPMLFKDLSIWRELDESFDYLTDEQKKFLRDFWINFEDKTAGSKEEFLKVWRELPNVYKAFVKSLKSEGLGYEGMIHREVAERITAGKGVKRAAREQSHQLIFAGFNALTKSEEVLMSHFVGLGAKVFWDDDPYYVDNFNQEAGQFFRQYRKHPVLSTTFEQARPSNFSSKEKTVNLYGVPQKVGQAKLLAKLLTDEVIPGNKPADEVRTVIVLPDETMLLSVMHSLPEAFESINVTMGFPLRSTPLCHLLELMLDLQINRKEDRFSHRQVTAILSHAYILSQEEEIAKALRLDIIHKNLVYIPGSELRKGENILKVLFQPIEPQGIAEYLLGVVQQLGAAFSDRQSFDREYAFHFHRHLSRLHEVLKETGSLLNLKGFQKLFRQIIQSQKIPFTGEPLKGLQIMGVLETRNLDFDNVFILSLNEGSLPAAPRQGSYIPHAVRKAYSLPTHEHQDAMYAYLFYRILQRARNIRLFYNTEPDQLGMGEMSRFVQQLIFESGWDIKHHILSNPVQLSETIPIDVAKTPEVLAALSAYTSPEGKGISPSALNDYIECTLRFYLKHIARLKEVQEVEEDLDARMFGNFLHDVMDWFYHDLIETKNSRRIEAEDLDPKKIQLAIQPLIDRAFRKHYSLDPSKEVEYGGQRVVVSAVIMQFAQKIIEQDYTYAPFTIEMIEERNFSWPMSVDMAGVPGTVKIAGRIDRVDSKDGRLRVIDYKTGKDELAFDSIESLFAREGKRNKAAFQTILYAWLYQQNKNVKGEPLINFITPVLMNRKTLFGKEGLKNFKMNKQELSDVTPYLPEFAERLQVLLKELYDPSIPFTQTAEEMNCKFCLFKNMCRR